MLSVIIGDFLEDRGVALGDRSELRAAIFSRSGDIRDRDVVDHPPFIPAAAAAGLPMPQKTPLTSMQADRSVWRSNVVELAKVGY